VGKPVFFIAEAGVNHDGSLEKALRLVEIAADCGADAVKFQTFRTEEVVMPGTAKADYQRQQTGEGSQYDMIRALELGEPEHVEIAQRCAERGIEFMSTPFEQWALDLLCGLGIRRVKIASGEVVNKPLIRAVARSGLPIILSTGMATLAEVERAVGWIRDSWGETSKQEAAGDLTILHCTSNYPAAPETINLRAMDTLRDALNLPVGYSDHSVGVAVSIAAVARGATIIEKHFTVDPSDPGPDHAASLSPSELELLIRLIRETEAALGDGIKAPAPSELEVRALVRRSAFARRAIQQGEFLTLDDIAFRRPSGGIGPEQVDELLGRRVARSIVAGAMVSGDDLI
jgi:N-acetylneuraminate synthase